MNAYLAAVLIVLTLAGLVAGIAFAHHNSRDHVYFRRRARERAMARARRNEDI